MDWSRLGKKAVELVKDRYNSTRSIKDIEYDMQHRSTELVHGRIDEIVNAKISGYIAAMKKSTQAGDVSERVAEVMKVSGEWTEKIKGVQDNKDLHDRFMAAMKADIDRILDLDRKPS